MDTLPSLEHKPESNVTPELVCLGKMESKPLEWLWPEYLPRGALVLLDGDPGLGKSFLTLDLAARLTTGRVMPPGEGKANRPPMDVLLLNAEDDLARTLRPRLLALGADLDRCHALTEITGRFGPRPVSLPEDVPVLEEYIRKLQIALVVIDPFMAYLTRSVDSHRDSAVRRVLHLLKLLAEQTQAAILLVRHLSKNHAVHDPLYRGGGSIGIIGAARLAWLVGQHPGDQGLRVLCRLKGNLGPQPSSYAYAIVGSNPDTTLRWEGTAPYGPFELLAHTSTPRGRPPEAIEKAKEFLLDILKRGPMLIDEVERLADLHEISDGTLRRAREVLDIITLKPCSFGGTWQWKLPAEKDKRPKAGSS